METPATDATDAVEATDDTEYTDHRQDDHQAVEQRRDHSVCSMESVFPV